tara:strand:+ start:1843 stop:4524 length:2682 start_codon:yes stop_codon:yes gene_type:complete
MTTYTGQTTLSSVAIVSSTAVLTNIAQGNLSSFGHVRSVLRRPGETNSIGLVMMGAVEFVGSRNTIPSGTNREYGYWRGSDNKNVLNKFDQLWIPLEGTGILSGNPRITTVKKTASDGDDSSCSESSVSWTWVQEIGGITFAGEWQGPGGSCAVAGCTPGVAPTRDGLYDGEVVYAPCTGEPSSSGSYSTEEKTASGVGASIGSSEWERAGDLIDQIGNEAIRERCLRLSERAHFNLGSGTNIDGAGYSAYVKVLPSGDVSNSVIISQHRENPALFVMGCDNDGLYYIRSDKSVSDGFEPVYAKTAKKFDEYKYPAQIVGVYASGDSKLKIYVNGKEEGSSSTFTRSTQRSANTDILLGKGEFPIAERGFKGWIDEVGVSSESFTEDQIQNLKKSAFELKDYIFNTTAVPTGTRGFSGSEFGDDSIAAKNTTYAEFVVVSGKQSEWNPTGARGGAFDTNLWGQRDAGGTHNFAVSSVLTFDLNELPTRLHQVTDLSIGMWAENSTTHTSGVNVSARVVHKDKLSNRKNISWHSHYAYMPNGSPRFISLTGIMPSDAYYKDGDVAFKSDLDNHQLELVFHYPPLPHPFDAEFKIYSTKMSFDGFDSLAQYNTKDGVTEASSVKGHSTFDVDGNFVSFVDGDRSLTLYSAGTSAVATTGTMNLFVNTTTADQALNLVINQDPVTGMGDTGYGNLSANAAIAMSGRVMNLFTKAGQIESDLVLFMKQDEPIFAASPTLPLSVAGSILSFPRAERGMSLYSLATRDQGATSGILNLAMPNVGDGSINAEHILYVGGKQPIAQIPLYLRTSESSTVSIPCYVLAPSTIASSGTLNMFIKQKDFYGESLINALPTILGTGNIPLNVTGHGYPSGVLELAMPEVFGSGTNTTTLNIKGYN